MQLSNINYGWPRCDRRAGPADGRRSRRCQISGVPHRIVGNRSDFRCHLAELAGDLKGVGTLPNW